MPDKPEEPFHYPADKARQGEIWQRIVFIAGLAGFVVLAQGEIWQRIVFIAGLAGFVVLALVLGWARYAY